MTRTDRESNPGESFDGGYHLYAREKHKERVAKNSERIDYAIKQFELNNIEFTLKNEQSGHFHCRRKSDDKLFQFWAGTGKFLDMTVCGEFIHLSNYCWGDAMAEEKLFEKRLERYLEKQGIYPFGRAADRMPVPPIGYYEKRWGGGFSKSGLPDLHLVANAISLDVELKAPTGRPSPLQKFMVSQINNAGSIGVILYPDGFEDFKNLLEGVIQCNTHIPVLNALKNAHSSTKCAIFSG